VRLTAAGITRTQDFMIVRNPAFKATDAELQAEFTLAQQINERLTTANEAVLRIRSLKEQIADRLAKTNDASVKETAKALADKLTDVEGEIYQYRNRSSQDPLNFPIRLNNKLAALQGLVEAGDSKPTDQSMVVFKDLSTKLEHQMQRLDALAEKELGALNKQLAGAGLEPIKDGVPPPTGGS
jgi:transketolase